MLIKTSSRIGMMLSREKGQFPVSIATSLALESLFNIHPDTKHKEIPIERMNTLWINIRTLWRNLYGSMERSNADMLSIQDLSYGVLEDYYGLVDVIRNYSPNILIKCFHSYYRIKLTSPFSRFREPTTPIQINQHDRMLKTIDFLLAEALLPAGDDIRDETKMMVVDTTVPELESSSGFLLSHINYDLLVTSSLSQLTLLESHTGNLKQKDKWYKRYYHGNALPELPFRYDLLQIFGDQVMFHPMKKSLREKVLELAKKYHWTYATTGDRIKQSVDYSHDYDLMALFAMLNKLD